MVNEQGQEGKEDEKDDDEEEGLNNVLRDAANLLPYCGGEAW